MVSAVSLRTDYSAAALRRLAAATRHANQSRRLLSHAAVLYGMNRTDAVRIGGMDRQSLRDWVQRFNTHGPDGLKDSWSKGNPPRLTPDQKAEFAHLVESGPDRAVDGVVRWRRIDLRRVIAERFSVTYHERTVGKMLHALGFAHLSPRPRHPAQDRSRWPRSSKLARSAEGTHGSHRPKQASRDLVPGRDAPWAKEQPRPAMGA